MQFAAGLLLVAGLGFAEALWFGSPFLPTLGWSVAFFVIAQIGYTIGLGVYATFRGSRPEEAAVRDPSPNVTSAPQAVDILRTAIGESSKPEGTSGHTTF
jgi:hypothetical protein